MPSNNIEYLLSLIPISDLFKDKPIKLTAARGNQIRKMDDKIKVAMRNMIASDKNEKAPKSDINANDFNTIKEYLQEERSPDMVAKQISDIPEAQGDEFTMISTSAIDNLRERLPVNQSETIFGIEDLPPSDFEINRFIRMVRVLENPWYAVDLINAGLITGTEVDALEMFYPQFLSSMQEAIVEGMIDLRAKTDTTSLGRSKNHIISTVLKVPRVTPQQLNILQSSYDEKKQAAEAPDLAESVQTDVSRVTTK